ncbi:hypothetical protein ENBRE01_1600 [Enteropsectra breve]|nr:hypothetical protein ENBRE01_1600 [Enteropsectra breve]
MSVEFPSMPLIVVGVLAAIVAIAILVYSLRFCGCYSYSHELDQLYYFFASNNEIKNYLKSHVFNDKQPYSLAMQSLYKILDEHTKLWQLPWKNASAIKLMTERIISEKEINNECKMRSVLLDLQHENRDVHSNPFSLMSLEIQNERVCVQSNKVSTDSMRRMWYDFVCTNFTRTSSDELMLVFDDKKSSMLCGICNSVFHMEMRQSKIATTGNYFVAFITPSSTAITTGSAFKIKKRYEISITKGSGQTKHVFDVKSALYFSSGMPTCQKEFYSNTQHENFRFVFSPGSFAMLMMQRV